MFENCLVQSFLLIISLIFINKICKKNNFLLSFTGNIHQKFASIENVPLTGGLLILLNVIFFLSNDFYSIKFFIFSMFFIGFMSDIKKIDSPKIRILIQLILILIYLFFDAINLHHTRIEFLDLLLNNYFFSLFFTCFCILIIINGSNFIDGINVLVIGYYTIICFAILYLVRDGYKLEELKIITNLLQVLVILFIFNFFNKLYLGDGGSYLLGFLISVILISFYLQNLQLSPFFIILLLWYPAYENLFSIFRKLLNTKSPLAPDTKHLHQLILAYLKQKLKKNNSFMNTLCGLMIVIYNGVVISIAMIDPKKTIFMLILILINLIVYQSIYYILKK